MVQRFLKLLEDNNTTIYKVAKETGVPSTCLYDWKTGKSTPSAFKLKKLADYFNVTIEYFLE